MMTKIQEELLKIAVVFDELCSRLKLRYFCFGGTALGAVRHHGFIPWDDDMDFAMPREDYEVFIREAPNLLPPHLFLQSHETEKAYFLPFAKIRNSSTTAIEWIMKDERINHGLWIDVFPLDGVPNDIRERRAMDRWDSFYQRRYMSSRFFKTSGWKGKIFGFFLMLLMPSKEFAYSKGKKIITRYPFGSTNYVLSPWSRGRSLKVLDLEFFDSFKTVEFETVNLRIPTKCEQLLVRIYGDWEKIPPEGKRTSAHRFVVLDLDKPYTEYVDFK